MKMIGTEMQLKPCWRLCVLSEEVNQFRRPWLSVPWADRETQRESVCSKMLSSNQARSSILTHHVDCIMNSQENVKSLQDEWGKAICQIQLLLGTKAEDMFMFPRACQSAEVVLKKCTFSRSVISNNNTVPLLEKDSNLLLWEIMLAVVVNLKVETYHLWLWTQCTNRNQMNDILSAMPTASWINRDLCVFLMKHYILTSI